MLRWTGVGRLRVCIVGPSEKFFSGISLYTSVLADRFAQKGHEVSLVLYRNLVPLCLYPGKQRVGRVNGLAMRPPGVQVFEGLDWNSPTTWLRGAAFLKRAQPDVCIFQWWTSSVAHMQLALLSAARKMSKRPIILLEMHEIADPIETRSRLLWAYARAAAKLVIRRCDVFVVHSCEARKMASAAYGIPEEKVRVIPHLPYDIYPKVDPLTARQELGVDGFVILYFGTIRQYKGLPVLLNAFNGLPDNVANDSRLVIVGEDWGDEPSLRRLVADSPYGHRILFLPQFVREQDVPKYFAAADVVVLPYLRTSGSGVLSLAMAHSKPVIATDLETLKESLVHYERARYFPKADFLSLRDRLVDAYWEYRSSRHETLARTSSCQPHDDVVSMFEDVLRITGEGV